MFVVLRSKFAYCFCFFISRYLSAFRSKHFIIVLLSDIVYHDVKKRIHFHEGIFDKFYIFMRIF